MPPYALSSIPLSTADEPAVDLNGRGPISRGHAPASSFADSAGRQGAQWRKNTADSVAGGRALTNPFSVHGSPIQLHPPLYNNSEWDLSTHSFIEDRGGGLVGYNQQWDEYPEGEHRGYGNGESLATWDTHGYHDEGDVVVREYIVGQQHTWGRTHHELETIPEASSEDISSLRSRGNASIVTVNSSIHKRGAPEHSSLDKDSRYPAFPLPSKTITTQPLPSITMSTREFEEIKERAMPRDWDTGLCSFSENCSKCCLGLWCPCVLYSQNKERSEQMRREGVPMYTEDQRFFTGDCISYALLSLCCFAWPLQTSNRAQIRDLLNIKGGCLGDCMTVCCCSACSLAQESRELTLEERELRLTISPSETM